MESIFFRWMFRCEDTHLEIICSVDFMTSYDLTWLILICNQIVHSFIARECRNILGIPRKFQVNSLKLGTDGISKKVNNTGEFFYRFYSKRNAWSKVHQMGVSVSGCKKCSFFGKLGVLCFLETPVLRFALLPYYRRSKEAYFGLSQTSMMESSTKIVNVLNVSFLA